MTQNDNRDVWLKERKRGIGGSEAAAVCGLSPWETPLEVYLRKTGELPEKTQTPEMEWGLRHEPSIAAKYSEVVGCGVEESQRLVWHRLVPFMFATIDGFCNGLVVEFKTSRSDEGWGRVGSDEIPDPYIVQVQQQLAVTDRDVADVAVLIAGSDFRIYTVERNNRLIDRLIAIESEFWDRVVSRTPPEPDWSNGRDIGALRKSRPRGIPRTVDLGDESLSWLNIYEDQKALEKSVGRAKEEAQARIIDAMDGADTGTFPDGRQVLRTVSVVKAHYRKESERVNFRIWEPKGPKHEQTEREQTADGACDQESGGSGLRVGSAAC